MEDPIILSNERELRGILALIANVSNINLDLEIARPSQVLFEHLRRGMLSGFARNNNSGPKCWLEGQNVPPIPAHL
jgi:hypothetical protein